MRSPLLCVALARPHRPTLVASDKATVILVVDVSGLDARDRRQADPSRRCTGGRAHVPRPRAEARPRRADRLLERAQIAAPPTTDRDVVRESLDELDFLQAYGGTAIGDALAAAVELGKKTVRGDDGRQTIAYTVASKNPLVTILFLSDGKQTRGSLQPLQGAERRERRAFPCTPCRSARRTACSTRQFGGFGGQGTPPRIPVPPDPATLKSIASLTGGKFFKAGSADALQSAYKELGSKLGRVPGNKEVTNEAVALAALLLVAAGILSARWAPRLP